MIGEEGGRGGAPSNMLFAGNRCLLPGRAGIFVCQCVCLQGTCVLMWRVLPWDFVVDALVLRVGFVQVHPRVVTMSLLVWTIAVVVQSVPPHGTVQLSVGMNFTVPFTTDIWSAGRQRELVPFTTVLKVGYTTQVRGSVARSPQVVLHATICERHMEHGRGLSYQGYVPRHHAANLHVLLQGGANETQEAIVRMYASPAEPNPSNSTVTLVEAGDTGSYVRPATSSSPATLVLVVVVGNKIRLEATVKDRFGIVVVRPQQGRLYALLCCCAR